MIDQGKRWIHHAHTVCQRQYVCGFFNNQAAEADVGGATSQAPAVIKSLTRFYVFQTE